MKINLLDGGNKVKNYDNVLFSTKLIKQTFKD